MVTVTQCPPGYAYGYCPIDSGTQFQELREDTLAIGITSAGHLDNIYAYEQAKDKSFRIRMSENSRRGKSKRWS